MADRDYKGRRCGKFFRAALAGAFLAFAASAVYAADAELGRYLASECMPCHGASTAASAIPNIFGIAPSAFIEVMKGYRSRELANPVMQTIASRLKDDEIEALAAYFAIAKRE